MDLENIYFLFFICGNNYNYDGKSVVEIRKFDISKEFWLFNYVTGVCREFDGIIIIGCMFYWNLKIILVLDEIYGGICKKVYVIIELVEGLWLNLFMKSFFDFVEDYIVYEIILGFGCNVFGYAGIMIGYILIFLVF